MQANDYQKLALSTANNFGDIVYTGEAQKVINGIFGLTGEVGEVADTIKKALFQGHQLDLNKLKSELGDVLWYIALLSNTYGFTLEDIMQTNIDKLNKRYPNGFSKEASINREENNGFYKLVETVGL